MVKHLIIILLIMCNSYAFDVVENKVVLTSMTDPTLPANEISNFTLHLIQTDNVYYDTCFWGVIDIPLGAGTISVKKVAYYAKKAGETDVWFRFDSANTSTQLPELKAAGAGKVKVSLYDDPATDTIFMIVSDTLKTQVIAYWMQPQGVQGWVHGNSVPTTFDDLTYVIVQNGNPVEQLPDAGGWSISNGDLIKAGVTYHSDNLQAIRHPAVDALNNVWFYGVSGYDTMWTKLQAFGNFTQAQTHTPGKFLMNLNDIENGWMGYGGIYKAWINHKPFFTGIDTTYVTADSILYWEDSIYIHDDNNSLPMYHFKVENAIGYWDIFTPDITQLIDAAWRVINNDTTVYIKNSNPLPIGYKIMTQLVVFDYSLKINESIRMYDTFYVHVTITDSILNPAGLESNSIFTNQSYKDTVYVTDAEKLRLINVLPSWMTASQISDSAIEISGTPTVSGEEIINLTLIDSIMHHRFSTTSKYYRTKAISCTLTISELPNNQPVIIGDGDSIITLKENENPVVFILNATDQDNDILTYSSNVTPTSQTDSIFTFDLSVGTHNIILSVNDGKATVNYNLTIVVEGNVTSIDYYKQEQSKMNVTVFAYNLQGQLIERIDNYHSLNIMPLTKNLTAGNLVYKLLVNGKATTKKVLITR